MSIITIISNVIIMIVNDKDQDSDDINKTWKAILPRDNFKTTEN